MSPWQVRILLIPGFERMMSMARYLYKFRISFKGAGFSGIQNPPEPSAQALKDLRKASSIVDPPSQINEKTFACQILMSDLVGKRLHMSFDPAVFPLNGSNPFISMEATNSSKLDVDRIFFPSGTYPVIDASKTMFLGLNGNWDRESFSKWEKDNGPLYGALTLSMDIGRGRTISPICFSSISMEYTGYRMPLTKKRIPLLEVGVSKKQFKDAIAEYPGFWIEMKRPEEKKPMAFFSGSLNLPFDRDKEGHSDSGKVECCVTLRKKSRNRSKWPVDGTITYRSGDNRSSAEIRANYAPLNRVKGIMKNMYSNELLLRMLKKSTPSLELARARWWINLLDKRAGHVKGKGWDNSLPGITDSIVLDGGRYRALLTGTNKNLYLLDRETQNKASLYSVFVPGSLKHIPEREGNVYLFRVDKDTFYLRVIHDLALLGDNGYSISFSYHQLLDGGKEKALKTACHWADISMASLMGEKEISLLCKKITTDNALAGDTKENDGILGFYPLSSRHTIRQDGPLREILAHAYRIEHHNINDGFDLKQDPEALSMVVEEINQQLGIELYPEAMEFINTYHDLKNGVRLFLDLKKQDEANRS